MRSSAPALLAAALALIAPPPAAAAPFVHPGVLGLDAGRLASIAARAAAGTEPQASFLAKAKASPQGNLSYIPFGPPPDGVVRCGSYDKPDVGCSNETSDADVAYVHALLYALQPGAGTQAYADRARGILNLWASRFAGYTLSNAPLLAGWCAAKFTRAAELLRWTPGSGWTPADTDAFNAMMYKHHVPLIYGGSAANGATSP